MNNQALWNSVQAFAFDNNDDPYNFSVRLAFENKWTHYITQQAILEYKKFMFLAATSNSMLSPSEIVDIVWHQHLLFSQSYNAFCSLLGKRIDHIPSTHNAAEKTTFAKAKEHTKKLYEENFGKQPAEFWYYSNPYDSIPVKKSFRSENSAYIILGSILVILFGLYLLSGPLVQQIPNPYFLLSIISLWIGSIVAIFFQYKKDSTQLVQTWKSSNIIANLTPLEMISLTKQNPSYVTHYYISRMVKQKNIRVTADQQLKFKQEPVLQDTIEKVLYTELKKHKSVFYASILKGINSMPLMIQFNQTRLELENIFYSSSSFVRMILYSTSALGFLMMLLLVRLTTGVSNDKNIGFLLVTIIGCLISLFFYWKFMKKYFWVKFFPKKFETVFIENSTDPAAYSSWQWKYFLGGTILAASLKPMIGYTQRNNGANCGSSCGSSCSSSCGGGDGGGCGGCGGGD